MNTAKEPRNTPSRDADVELGTRAHMLIWNAGRKQGDIASEIGMSSGSLGLKLKGQRGWALAEIKGIADALNTSVAYLVGETEDMDSPDPKRRSRVPKVAGSTPVGGTLISFPTRHRPVKHKPGAPIIRMDGRIA